MDSALSTNEIKKIRKQQKKDRMRALRVVEYLEFGGVMEKCPVEIMDGYIISDIDTYELFASFVFKNVGVKKIEKLGIRLLCFKNQNIPYIKLPFEYSDISYTLGRREQNGEKIKPKHKNRENLISTGETFGKTVYIPLPESYFTKLEVEISFIKYADGTIENFGIVVGRNYEKVDKLDDEEIFAYHAVNMFAAAEARFPIRVMPQKGEYAWLCCCGHKNSSSSEKCDKCLRDKNWEFEHIQKETLHETADEMRESGAPVCGVDKTKYSQTKYLETKDEVEQKKKAYELAMKVIAEEEKRSEKLKIWFVPKVIICMVVIYLLLQLAISIFGK